MTYEELKIQFDLCDPVDVLKSVGIEWYSSGLWFVVCDDGDCHLFKDNGEETDIRRLTIIYYYMIHDKIKKIHDKIKKIIIPNSVTSIGYSMFIDCSRLESVTIPDSVMNIGDYAFDNYSELKSLIFKGKTMNEVEMMDNYPWGLKDVSIIKCI